MIRRLTLSAAGVVMGLLLSVTHGCGECPPPPPKPVGSYTVIRAENPAMLGIDVVGLKNDTGGTDVEYVIVRIAVEARG